MAVQIAAQRAEQGVDLSPVITGKLLAVIRRLATEVEHGAPWADTSGHLPLRSGPAPSTLRATVGRERRHLNISASDGH